MVIVKVDVTDKDIQKGKVGDVYSCPVALASNRAFRGARTSAVPDWSTKAQPYVRVRHGGDPTGVCYIAPLSVDAFIKSFDAGNPVKPFSFTLDLDRKFPIGY